MSHPPYVAVVGPGEATPQESAAAEEVGRRLAARGAVVVCGGLGGVMEAVARGAGGAGGTVVGLLPTRARSDGNPYLTVALPTGLGELRNGLVVGVADGVIAVGGSWGTMSEVALALRTGKPVVSLGGWALTPPSGGVPGPRGTATPQEAVETVLALVLGVG
ncbi:TIGR00725 family protein [Streptacidiphilus neutrinimicus]|uniref:TIGR00725 family protein n=1 Tax=Streptacidiphilus neutrinimicus TaxID=105420 RepID=UPI0005A7C558|nr:TIGR00725 family protein [Streptacidiphilus neutrinimicus]